MSQKMARSIRQRLNNQSIDQLQTVHQKISHILGYGVLAPSTHNTQPWKLKIIDNAVEIHADFTKRIPVADPTARDLYISLGALTKNIELASAAFGIVTDLKICPNLKNNVHVATISFKNIENLKNAPNTETLASITGRQNYRGFFRPSINKSDVKKIVKPMSSTVKASVFYDKHSIIMLAELTAEGLKLGYSNPEFRKEISSYINHNLSRKRHGLHGYSLRMSLPISIAIPKIMKRRDISKKLAAKNFTSFISAPVVMVLSSKDTEREWFETGRVLEEMLVKLTGEGLGSSIYAAAVEMGDLRPKVAKITKLQDSTYLPQLVVCIGQPSDTMPPSVRKKLSNVLIT